MRYGGNCHDFFNPDKACGLANVAARVRCDDVDLAELIGNEVEGGYLVRRKDIQVFERQLKKLCNQAQRLEGKRVVVRENFIVTAYHARRGKEQRLLRNADDRSLVRT